MGRVAAAKELVSRVRMGEMAWWKPVATLALALAAWPVPGMQPRAGLDPSWQIALHMAASDRLTYGRDVVFTYGPLGFLSIPLTVTVPTAVASIAFTIVLWFA